MRHFDKRYSCPNGPNYSRSNCCFRTGTWKRPGIRKRSTAQKDRVNGTGIPFIRIGGLVRYRKEDVERFLAELPTRRSTSEPKDAA